MSSIRTLSTRQTVLAIGLLAMGVGNGLEAWRVSKLESNLTPNQDWQVIYPPASILELRGLRDAAAPCLNWTEYPSMYWEPDQLLKWRRQQELSQCYQRT